MPARLLQPARPARALVAAALGGALALGALAGAPTSEARTAPCSSAGRSVAPDRATLEQHADDGTFRIDECGQLYVVDRAVPAAQRVVADHPAGVTVPDDVFALSSRPSSPRTLYLDFDGSTYTGTAWQSGATIESAAYSIDADPTTFSTLEREQIHLAWRSVAEDFAPFDVNVTTQVPGADALTRTSRTDPTYGMAVVVTPTNSVGAGCSCGGKAYVGVFDAVDNRAYQPGWVFTNGSGTGGYNVGQVISHEAGHTFGLGHDGTATSGYYSGANGWAPIMGASYGRRASQWSRGEYAGANNAQDDVAVLAAVAPTLADDHGGPAAATPLAPGVPVAGLVTSRADTDAFTFTAAGPTTLAVAGPPGVSDLDVLLTVLDAQGQVVAAVDPSAVSASDASLDATWTADLPATAATYTAVVDGTSHGDPASPGGYSDYGSLGAYAVTLTTAAGPGVPTPTSTPTPTPIPTPAPTPTVPPAASPVTPGGRAAPLAFVTRRLPAARAGARYRAAIEFSGPVVEARVGWRLPAGLRWRVRGTRVVVSGRLPAPGVRRVTVELTGEDGATLRHRFRIRVR